MNRRIERLIPIADEIVGRVMIHENKVKSVYNGYIASFGSSVIQSGMLITLYFNFKDNASEERKKLREALYELIISAYPEYLEGINLDSGNLLNLYQAHLNVSSNLKKLTRDILEAAITLKLIIRTYERTDD